MIAALFRRRTKMPPAYAPPRNPWAESADADTLRFLYRQISDMRCDYLEPSHWIMSPLWYQNLRELKDAYGLKYWIPPEHNGTEYLMGIPVRVHPWAGLPALVAKP